jgi:hypothetical protein
MVILTYSYMNFLLQHTQLGQESQLSTVLGNENDEACRSQNGSGRVGTRVIRNT